MAKTLNLKNAKDAIIDLTGLKVNELPPAAAVNDQSLFVVADAATGNAFQATERQVKDAIAVSVDFKSATPATVPTGAKDGSVYFPTTPGTYTNFLNQGGTALTYAATDGIAYFIYNGTYWTKIASTTDLTNYVAKANLQNNFNAIAAKTTALDASLGKFIKDTIDVRTAYGPYILQTLTTEAGAVNSTTGALDNAATTWTRAVNIVVVPGQKMKFTVVNSENSGIAGYDQNGVFLSALDSYNLPIGNLWNNTRYAKLTNTTVNTGRVLYTDIEIIIPANCYLVKACSATTTAAPVSPVIISLETWDATATTVKQAIATNAADIAKNQNALLTNSFKLQTLSMVAGSVTAQTGVLSASPTGWTRAVNIAVVPGQKMRLTCACSFTYGTCGYDKNGNFLGELDSYGLPYGHLWSKQRWTALTGLTDADNATKLFIDVEITIPANCYLVKASTNSGGAAPQKYPLIVSLETVEPTNKSVKQQVNENLTDINNIEKQLLGANDVTGTTFQPESIKTTDGTLNTPSAGNVYEHSDFITVREASEAGKDIFLVFTGVVTGTRGDSTLNTTGLAGYDASGNFLSTLDAFGIQEGAIWDYDRWTQNQFYPARTAFSGNTHAFTDVTVKIPANCYKVRGAGAVTNSAIGVFPLVIKKCYTIPNLGQLIAGGGNDAAIKSNYMAKVAGNVIAWGKTAGNPNAKRFTFIHFSDIHYYSLNYKENHEELNAFVNDSDAAGEVDAVLCGGDISEGIAARGKAATMGETQAFSTELLKSQKPVMYCPGNHDDNVNFDGAGLLTKTGVYNNAISKAELYALFNGAIKTRYNLLQVVNNKLYSYQDFSGYNIRVIALDRYEDPVIDDGAGTNMLRYKNANEAGHWYSQGQLDWLQTTLASVPAGWGVIVLSHGNLVSNVSDFSTLTCLQGWNLIPAIIDAWKRGATYVHSFTHPKFADMNTAKTFDFTARGTGEFICYLGGHSHCTYYGFIPAFNTQRTLAVACTFTGGMDQSTANTWGMVRGNNQEIRNSFHIISVDRTNKKLYINFFGAHKDLSGNITTDSLIIPY